MLKIIFSWTVGPAAAQEAVEEIVVVAPTDAQILERSAQAVLVVDLDAAKDQSADLGEVLARSQGVGVRRGGALGSGAQLSLGGFTGAQVRTFLDGVPLELAGYPLGLATVPLDLVEHVEVFRGVVPVRFGADALGGAVNLASTDAPGGSVSYQGGSWDTHRLAASARVAAKWGGFARGDVFLDASRNDYLVDVEVPDELGRLQPVTARRFHDAYRAQGGSVEVGLADRPWAERLAVRVFGASLDQELQNNVVMSVPYGEAEYGVGTAGATARWRAAAGPWSFDALTGYTATTTTLTDLAGCVYDWFGRCVADRPAPGEIEAGGADRVVRDDALVGRFVGRVRAGAHAVTLSVAPTAFWRTGEDRLWDGSGRDPLTAQRESVQVVSGLEHQLDAGPLQNLLFVKEYHQAVRSEEPLVSGLFERVDRTTDRIGVGDGARVKFGPGVIGKVSWEWATRLPTPEEVFGDGVLIVDSLALAPETSHNANLGFTVEQAQTRAGVLRLDTNLFVRSARDLIVLLGTDRSFSYQNVFSARSVGAEGAAGWTSPGDWVAIDVNGTWLDLRNTSADGAFADFAGDRIPNRPWLFANGTVRIGFPGVVVPQDRLTVDLHSRYVHSFYRGWESAGLTAFKDVVPMQLSHALALTWAVAAERARVATSVEVQNLTDARLYDFFGVQRPGRSVFGKVSVGW